jgi:hypothetical protein
MSVVTQLYFQIVEEIIYMCRPFSSLNLMMAYPEKGRNM